MAQLHATGSAAALSTVLPPLAELFWALWEPVRAVPLLASLNRLASCQLRVRLGTASQSCPGYPSLGIGICCNGIGIRFISTGAEQSRWARKNRILRRTKTVKRII